MRSSNTLPQVNVTSFNASYGGEQAHAWTITFMSIRGDVGRLVINGTKLSSGEVTVTERVKVRLLHGFTFLQLTDVYYIQHRPGRLPLKHQYRLSGL